MGNVMRGSFKKRLAGAVAAAALATGAAPAHAAGGNLEPILRLTAEQRYDDDALLRNAAGGEGQFITRISPQGGALYKDRGLQFEGWYSPDVLYYETTHHASLEHRGSFQLKKKLSEVTRANVDLKIWRVSDPTSLPRLGIARSIEPILYGKADLSMDTRLAERWNGKVGYHFEGVQIYHAGEMPGFVNAPFAETSYRVTRRSDLGVGYRFQLFTFGAEVASSNSAYLRYATRLTRSMTFTADAGPAWYNDRNHPERTGLLPRANLELARQGPKLDLGLNVGHDLVGASGFANAVWADYAGLVGAYRFLQGVPLKVFAAASYFRDGQPPSRGVLPLFSSGQGVSQGYSVGGGLEWRFNTWLAAQGAFDRFSQLGGQYGVVTADLTRNVVSARLNMTAFQ